MKISNKAKERFCKDCNLPIKLFQEPYFSDRIKLYDPFYGTIEKWNRFVNELQKYNCEQDYFEEYNRVKDAAISYIKESEAYQKFNSEDMNVFSITHKDLPGNDIFKSSNNGRTFISIDMRKANFSSLQSYDKGMFGNVNTWEDFISMFTNNKHIVDSKYIRQVILGNCNPKRHITYEKWIMDQVLTTLEQKLGCGFSEKVVFFSNDEIVYDVTDFELVEADKLRDFFHSSLKEDFSVPFRVELFDLYKINGTDGYCKKIHKENGEYNIEFKCLDSYMTPFVIRNFLGEKVNESDKVFYHQGLLSKFIDLPKIEVNFCLDKENENTYDYEI